jgi:hypothetical protein
MFLHVKLENICETKGLAGDRTHSDLESFALRAHSHAPVCASSRHKLLTHDSDVGCMHVMQGPDDTIDEDEFSEVLTFYKFNVRILLSI